MDNPKSLLVYRVIMPKQRYLVFNGSPDLYPQLQAVNLGILTYNEVQHIYRLVVSECFDFGEVYRFVDRLLTGEVNDKDQN